MNYIITKHPEFFDNIGDYNFCDIKELEGLPEKISFDSETTGLNARENDMFCCQIGTGTNNYLVHQYDDNYTFKDVIPYIKNCIIVMQNGLFDLGFMYKYKFVPKKVYDTMLATRILYNGDISRRRADFQAIMEREINVWYDKTSQKNIHIVKLSVPTAIEYSFNDVDRLLEAHDVLLEKIKEEGALLTYELHCRFIKALAYMEQCGLPINKIKWSEKMAIDRFNAEKYKAEIGEYIYDTLPKYAHAQLDLFDDFKKDTFLNLNSSKQMIPVFNDLGIKTKDKYGKDSIDKKIISKSKHEFVDLWFKYQEANHRVTTFGQTILDKTVNDRIYTNFNPMVDTARLSTRRGHINFLNFPKDRFTRDAFEAPGGQKMIVCDWSGQETVIAADVSGDRAMTKSVVDGDDLHCMMARVIYPKLALKTDKQIIENYPDERQFSKAPRFAMQYGGNDYTLHVNENIPLKEAKIIFEQFIELHRGLFDWGKEQFRLAVKRGYIKSVDGWRLHLPKYEKFMELRVEINAMSKNDWAIYRAGKQERIRELMILKHNKNLKEGEEEKEFIHIDEDAYNFYRKKKKPISDFFSLRSEYERLTLNNPIQTRGAHQMKRALSEIFEWIVENDYMFEVLMCNAVHDETICQAPNELANDVKQIVEKSMREAGDYYLTDLKIKADANVGQTWYEAK